MVASLLFKHVTDDPQGISAVVSLTLKVFQPWFF